MVGAVAFGNLDRPERHLEFVSLAPESASSWPTLRFRALRSLRSCGKGLRGDEDEAGVLASGCLVLGVEGG